MPSPIDVLKEFIFPTLRRIAPENGDDLIAIVESKGIKFRLVAGEERILFTADSANGLISVGEKCLERLWAIAYAYFVFYEAISKAKHKDRTTESIELSSDPQLQVAGELLSWATSVDWQIKAEGGGGTTPVSDWPPLLPKPVENPPKSSNEDVTDKLFLSAVAFILHHELAHIEFGHTRTTGTESILNEKDADRAAAKWLLDGLDPASDEFFRRVCGIAVAFLWTAVLTAYVPVSGETHPPGYDRLYQTIYQFVSDDWHPVWGFISVALPVHLDASGATYDEALVHSTPRDAVNYYCDVLSKRFRGAGV